MSGGDKIFGAPSCHGSYLLGTACGKCPRCESEKQALIFAEQWPVVREAEPPSHIAQKLQLPTEWSDESRDLCALAADRVSASLESVTQLCTTPEDGLRVSISALAAPLGAAVGFYAAMVGREPQDVDRRELLDAVLELVDEVIAAREEGLKTAGGAE